MADRNTEITLYSNWRSSSAWRIRIVLNLKNIEHVTKSISLAAENGDQLADSFQAVNPMGRVPALDVGGNIIIESPAIMEYLNERYPQPPLLPEDLIERAKVRSICQLIVSDIQPLQNSLSVLNKLDEKKRKTWAVYWIKKGFTALEKVLEDVSGIYCVGNTVTLADCCLAPQVFNARGFHVDMETFPKILQISLELEKIPAFKRAHPNLQPDCPEDLKFKIC